MVLSKAEEEKFIQDNLRLVTFCIKKYFDVGEDDFEDLFQEGCYALLLAVRRFDESKGFQFSTYATKYISGYLARYKRQRANYLHGLHISRTEQDKYAELLNFASKYELDLEEDVDIIQEILGIDIKPIQVASLNKTLQSEDNGKLTEQQDLIADTKDTYENIYFNDFIDSLLKFFKKNLTKSHYKIMKYILDYYKETGIALTRKELSKKLGYSHTYISRVLNTSVKALREKGFYESYRI
jgi:RNA polymerase sigma factor (sigma-70 family)